MKREESSNKKIQENRPVLDWNGMKRCKCGKWTEQSRSGTRWTMEQQLWLQQWLHTTMDTTIMTSTVVIVMATTDMATMADKKENQIFTSANIICSFIRFNLGISLRIVR